MKYKPRSPNGISITTSTFFPKTQQKYNDSTLRIQIKPLIILDINGILCHRLSPISTHYDHRSYNAVISRTPIIPRPNLESFVDYLINHFCVAIWTSAKQNTADRILNSLIPNEAVQNKLLFVWTQDKCTKQQTFDDRSRKNKVIYQKELTKVWEEFPFWNTSNTLMIDDSPEKCIDAIPNCLHPIPMNGKKDPTYDEAIAQQQMMFVEQLYDFWRTHPLEKIIHPTDQVSITDDNRNMKQQMIDLVDGNKNLYNFLYNNATESAIGWRGCDTQLFALYYSSEDDKSNEDSDSSIESPAQGFNQRETVSMKDQPPRSIQTVPSPNNHPMEHVNQQVQTNTYSSTTNLIINTPTTQTKCTTEVDDNVETTSITNDDGTNNREEQNYTNNNPNENRSYQNTNTTISQISSITTNTINTATSNTTRSVSDAAYLGKQKRQYSMTAAAIKKRKERHEKKENTTQSFIKKAPLYLGNQKREYSLKEKTIYQRAYRQSRESNTNPHSTFEKFILHVASKENYERNMLLVDRIKCNAITTYDTNGIITTNTIPTTNPINTVFKIIWKDNHDNYIELFEIKQNMNNQQYNLFSLKSFVNNQIMGIFCGNEINTNRPVYFGMKIAETSSDSYNMIVTEDNIVRSFGNIRVGDKLVLKTYD